MSCCVRSRVETILSGQQYNVSHMEGWNSLYFSSVPDFMAKTERHHYRTVGLKNSLFCPFGDFMGDGKDEILLRSV